MLYQNHIFGSLALSVALKIIQDLLIWSCLDMLSIAAYLVFLFCIRTSKVMKCPKLKFVILQSNCHASDKAKVENV